MTIWMVLIALAALAICITALVLAFRLVGKNSRDSDAAAGEMKESAESDEMSAQDTKAIFKSQITPGKMENILEFPELFDEMLHSSNPVNAEAASQVTGETLKILQDPEYLNEHLEFLKTLEKFIQSLENFGIWAHGKNDSEGIADFWPEDLRYDHNFKVDGGVLSQKEVKILLSLPYEIERVIRGIGIENFREYFPDLDDSTIAIIRNQDEIKSIIQKLEREEKIFNSLSDLADAMRNVYNLSDAGRRQDTGKI